MTCFEFDGATHRVHVAADGCRPVRTESRHADRSVLLGAGASLATSALLSLLSFDLFQEVLQPLSRLVRLHFIQLLSFVLWHLHNHLGEMALLSDSAAKDFFFSVHQVV